MRRDDAEAWCAFLCALRGKTGSFLMGHPGARLPRGSAVSRDPDPNWLDYEMWSASVGAKEITIQGFRPNESGVLLAGDWIQISRNMLLNTEKFDQANVWFVNNGTVTTATAIDPTGVARAGRITPTGSNCYVAQSVSAYGTRGREFRYSIWLRALSGSPTIEMSMREMDGSWTPFAATSVNLTGSWTRFFLTGTPTQNDGVRVVIGAGTPPSWPISDGALELAIPTLTCDILDVSLHKVLADADSDSSGEFVPVDIFPRLHKQHQAFSKVILERPLGTWRLASNRRDWDLDEAMLYGISFSAIEAL